MSHIAKTPAPVKGPQWPEFWFCKQGKKVRDEMIIFSQKYLMLPAKVRMSDFGAYTVHLDKTTRFSS